MADCNNKKFKQILGYDEKFKFLFGRLQLLTAGMNMWKVFEFKFLFGRLQQAMYVAYFGRYKRKGLNSSLADCNMLLIRILKKILFTNV